jgi:hypothetical protein
MPVILSRDDYGLRLDPGMTNVEAVSDLLKPFDARLMRMFSSEQPGQPGGERR